MASTTPAPTRGRPRWTAGRVAAAAVVVGLVAMWAYAFSGAARQESPLRVGDRRWAAAAEEACRPMADAVGALPGAETAATPEERAAVLAEANGHVEAAVARLEAVPRPSDADDAELVDWWLGHWRTYLADREAYAEVLAAGRDERFTLTDVGGAAVTEPIDEFAGYNDIVACETPGDV